MAAVFEVHQPFGLGVGKSAQQDAVDDAEDRGRGADAEAQHDDDGDGECRSLTQAAQREEEIVVKYAQHVEAPG